jgi:hypothetical protein
MDGMPKHVDFVNFSCKAIHCVLSQYNSIICSPPVIDLRLSIANTVALVALVIDLLFNYSP